jgi:uncharacterized membrane protein
LITNGRPVEPGTSGAVSVVGFLAALGGAGLIGLAAALGTKSAAVLPIVTLAGVLGTTIDSLLGATAQAIYYCPSCQKETERHPLHACGTATVHRRGWSWLRNDEVNFVASLAGAAAAMIWIRFG